MKKVLLSMATLAFIMSANAQLLTYDFETVDESKIVAENWTDFSDSQYDFSKAGVGVDGSKALYANTTGTCQTYQRVIALKNVGVGENKAYRISLKAKGTGTINVGILKGCFYHDKALLLNGKDQVQDFAVESADEFKTIEYQVWAPSRSVMAAANSDFNQDEYWNQDFLRLSFNAEGETYVDNVVVEEVAPVSAAVFNGQAIKISFLGPTNLAALAAEGPVELDNACVTVKVNGEETEPEIVELKADGSLYIFMSTYISDEDALEITFNNGVGFKYTDNNAEIQKFTVSAVYDADFSASASAYEEAQLVSSVPANTAFEIAGSINTFSFTFNKPVSTNDEDNDAPTASLVGPDVEEDLVLVANAELDKTLVFKRSGSGTLADGVYYITLDNVSNAMHVATTTPFVLSFEVGEVNAATTIYGDPNTTLLEGANSGQPTDWSIMVGGENWAGGELKADNGSACRNLNVTGTDGVERTAFYLCDRDGYTYMQSPAFTLPAGDLEFSVIGLSHDEAGHTLEFVLEDMEGNKIASGSDACSIVANNSFTSIEASNKVSTKFNNPTEQNFILKIHAPQGGYTAVRVLGYTYRTYTMSEGDRYEPEIIFTSDFTGGNMPAEGTGWLCYDNNNKLEPGSGRNGTSGMLERNFHKNMQSAAFFRECGSNENAAHRIEYGNGNGVEGGIEIPAGTYDVTYYAGTWNDNNGNANGASKVYFDIIDAESNEVVFHDDHVCVANFGNGGACNGQADVVRNSITLDGKYIFKAWGTTNTVWGGLTIEKPGKTAVKYHSLLDLAVEAASEDLNNAKDDKYNGTTKTALTDLIAKYSVYPNGMSTADEYYAAIDALEKSAKALKDRCASVDAYESDLAKILAALEDVKDTKYEALPIVVKLQDLYEKYAEVPATSLEDAELIPVQKEITAGVSGINNAKNAVDNLITKQIHNLLDQISVYADKLDDEFALGWISRADATLTDDQAVADQLQKILTACIYDSIANGYNFSIYDEEADMTLADSLNITGYIANNMFYTVNPQKTYQGPAANAAFPGWNITEGDVSNVWWWENTLSINESQPAVDASIHNTGNNAFKVNQALKNLPVGVYTMIMKTADCSNIADVGATYTKKDESLPWSTSEVYAKIGEDVTSVTANYGEGQVWRNAADTYLMNIQGKAQGDEKTVAMTIGANINCTNDAAQVDDTRLFMVAKLDGFDYKAAAAALMENIPSGLKAVERTDAPVAVQYFNLAGQKSAAQGVNIKVETYSDGYTVVKKVIVK